MSTSINVFPSLHHLSTDSDLNDILISMSMLGEPILHKMDRGWHCSIDMFVTGKGVCFTVKSDFTCNTPKDAAFQCIERIKASLNKLTGDGND